MHLPEVQIRSPSKNRAGDTYQRPANGWRPIGVNLTAPGCTSGAPRIAITSGSPRCELFADWFIVWCNAGASFRTCYIAISLSASLYRGWISTALHVPGGGHSGECYLFLLILFDILTLWHI